MIYKLIDVAFYFIILILYELFFINNILYELAYVKYEYLI